MENIDQEKIDLYLQNKMDEKMRQDFEAQMNTNSVLAEEVRLQQTAFDLLDAMGDQEVKDKLDRIHEKVIGKQNTPFYSKRYFLVLIGAIAILLLTYYFFSTKNSSPDIIPDRVYLEYYEPYPISFASRGNDLELKFEQANALYSNQQYQESLSILEQLMGKSNDTKLRMAAGISALETGATDKALNYFNELINTKDPLLQNQAKWYAALTTLKSNRPTLAKTYLQSLLDSNSKFKKEESQRLLEKLK